MVFYLQKAKAVLEKATSQRNAKSLNEVELDNGLVFTLKLSDQGAHDAADFFFPGYSIVEDRIAEHDGKHPGLSATVRLSPPAMTFVIYDGAGVNKVFELQGANIKGAVKFDISNQGEGVMKLTLGVKLSKDDMSMLHDYLGADVQVSAVDMQPDMFGIDDDDGQTDLEEGCGMTGAEMRSARAAFGWTLEDLATKLGVSPKSIGRYERGARIMPTDVADKAKALFDMKPDVDHEDEDALAASIADEAVADEPVVEVEDDIVFDDEQPAA